MRHVTVLLLSAAVFALAPAVRAADEPKDIIAKAIKANGGEEKLNKFQAGITKIKGKLQVPNIGETDFTSTNSFMYPDKFKEEVELTVAGMKIAIVSIGNGDQYSINANGTEVPIEDNLKKVFKNASHAMKVARLTTMVKDKGYELSLLGESDVNKAKAIGIKVAMKDHTDVNLYFDVKTHYLVKVESRTIDPASGNEVTEERILQGYEKNADGLATPKKITVLRDGKPYMDAEILEMKFLEKLDEGDFKK